MSPREVAPRSSRRTQKQIGALLLGLAISLTLAACGSSSPTSSGSSSPSADPPSSHPLSVSKVNLGIAETPEGDLMIIVAQEQGYWAKLGLTVNIESVPTGPAQLAGIAGGSLQICQSGPSTTMVPIQEGQANVEFVAATQTAIPWQLVISKSWASSHGITAATNPNQIIPKMKGATFAGVSGPTDSIATVQGYALRRYGVTGATTDYLGSPTAMFAALAAGRADAYIDVLGQSFQAEAQDGAIVVNLADLPKLTDIAEAIPSFFTVSKTFAAHHGDTVTAFLTGLWKAWEYIKDPAHHKALVAFIQKQYPGTPTAAADYFIQFSAEKGMWMSQQLWQNTVNLANTTLKPPLTVTYAQVTDPKFEQAAIKSLGITPPGDNAK
jgi:ABC-type nitrate/sulfonate/bicarbonate transport system substrate-binding protein